MLRKTGLILIPMAAGAIITGAIMSNFGVQPTHAQQTTQAQQPTAEVYRHLNLFGDVFERIRAEYVEAPDEKILIETAVNGMLTNLDPHSSYLSAESFEAMRVQTSGEFGGLGIEVTMEEGLVKVVTPIDDTPAQRAGVLSGDLIIEIDGEQVRGLTLNDAVDKMRGRVDTSINIKVVRENVPDPITFEIVREVIQIRSVRFEAIDDIGYVRISSFTQQTFSGLKKAFDEINEEFGEDNIKGWVIDLRSNPGGLLDQAVAVSDGFLNQGEIVSTRGRDPEEIDRYTAREGDLSDGKPVIVLINGGSASASEIVAGALQDHKRATILGTRSFGKGSVQTIIPLGQNGAIRLTTARYYTPAGTSIQAKGIEPDISVIQKLPEELQDRLQARSEASLRGHLSATDDEEGAGSVDYVPAEKDEDTQLQYAFSLIKGDVNDDAYILEYKETQN